MFQFNKTNLKSKREYLFCNMLPYFTYDYRNAPKLWALSNPGPWSGLVTIRADYVKNCKS